MANKATCVLCGKEFIRIGGRQTLCTECRERIKYNLEHLILGACPVCGKSVLTLSKSNKYCSKRCQLIAKRLISYEHNHGIRRRNVPPAYQEPVVKATPKNHLDQMALEARNNGLSYGQYQAWKRGVKKHDR